MTDYKIYLLHINSFTSSGRKEKILNAKFLLQYYIPTLCLKCGIPLMSDHSQKKLKDSLSHKINNAIFFATGVKRFFTTGIYKTNRY